MRHDRTSLEHGNRQAWALAGIILALLGGLAALAAVIVVGARESSDSHNAAAQRAAITHAQDQRVQCIATWANTWAARAEQQQHADAKRLAALDRLARSLQHAGPATLAEALRRYLAASDTYNTQLRAHPLPRAPKFLCNEISSSTLPDPAVVTVTPSPSTVTRSPSTVTRTVHPHVTPAPTVIVTRPGPTHTVRPPRATVTRPAPTVTETRPPGRPGPSHGRACVLGLFC